METIIISLFFITIILAQHRVFSLKLNDARDIPMHNPNPLVQFDEKGKLLFANPASKIICSEIDEKGIDCELLSDFIEKLDDIKSGRKPVICEKEMGNVIYQQTIVPVKKKSLTTFLVYSYDVTILKKAEDEMREAMESAEDSNRAKSEFLANMSHELRTPMNGVIGMSELLGESELDSKQRKYNDLVKTSAESLLAILNDILDLSKIEVGELAIQEDVINLKEELENTVSLLYPFALKRNPELKFSYPEGLTYFVNGDGCRISQIVRNLISNAIKFTDNGKVEVSVKTEEHEGKEHFRFEVSDTGIGIPESHRDFIFGKFTQVNQKSSRKYGGTGLGLAITKSLVEMMRGQIGVESVEGEGSTFWFRVPIEKREDIAEVVKQYGGKTMSKSQNENLNLEKARILLVEDHEVNQMLAKKLLKKMGATSIDLANNGIEALRLVSDRKYDIILMDCQMPEMDGYEATREIREIENLNGHRTPIVAMTANAMAGDMEKCVEHGMDDYVSKPINVNSFKKALLTWIDDKNIERHEPETNDNSDKNNSDNPVDVEHLRMFVDTKEEERELFEAFIKKAIESIDELQKSNADSENENWRLSAHSFKGAAANLGAKMLAEHCSHAEKNFEDSADDKNLILDKITNEFERVQTYINKTSA